MNELQKLANEEEGRNVQFGVDATFRCVRLTIEAPSIDPSRQSHDGRVRAASEL